MRKKLYLSATGSDFTIITPYGVVEFDRLDKTFGTNDGGIQKCIEASSYFKNGQIVVLHEEDAGADDLLGDGDAEEKAHPGVSDYQAAAEVLHAEYGVPKSKLSNAKAIRRAAEQLRVVFPDLGE